VLATDILIHGISISKAMISAAQAAKAGSFELLGTDLAQIASVLTAKNDETLFIY